MILIDRTWVAVIPQKVYFLKFMFKTVFFPGGGGKLLKLHLAKA